MNATVFVATPQNVIIDELDLDLGPVSWRMGDVGKTTLAITSSDPKATRKNFAFGNRILIEFDNGLPAWGGLIDTPRKWTSKKLIATAYSAEHLLSKRITGKSRTFSNATIGGVFLGLLDDANAQHQTGIKPGEVWGGGAAFSPDYHYDQLLKIFQELCGELSTSEWTITASREAGRIEFLVNLAERLGQDKRAIALVEGANIDDVKLDEQGPLINWWDVAGQDLTDGNQWGSGRLTGHAHDNASWGSYDLRQDSLVLSDVGDRGELQARARSALAQSKQPHNMLDLTVSDIEPGRFEEYGLGDIVSVELTTLGFGGYKASVRVRSREYDPSTGLCKLVVQEWFDGG